MKNLTTGSDEAKERSDSSASPVLYLLAGGSIGAITALLLAPKSGRELRQDIVDKTHDGYDLAQRTAVELQDLGVEIAGSLKKSFDSLSGSWHIPGTRSAQMKKPNNVEVLELPKKGDRAGTAEQQPTNVA